MERFKFETDQTYLPITMKQFEALTNEILTTVNTTIMVDQELYLDADYMAQILMSAIHAMDHKHGWVSKTELFDSCVNRISCHVTYHVVQEIQERLKAKAKADIEEAKDKPKSAAKLEIVQDANESMNHD